MAQTPVFYGMTYRGGTNNLGTIINFNPANNSESVVWNFGGIGDGQEPWGSLIYVKSRHAFYGFTETGGVYTYGTIIKFNPTNNQESVAWSFGYGTDGQSPYGNLAYDPVNGMLYGMTAFGGTAGAGTIIEFNPVNGQESVVWNFGSHFDGAIPKGSLVYDTASGCFYGMTSIHGLWGYGAIIRFNPVTNQDSVVWSFGMNNDGEYPNGSLVYDTTTHLFYGMTNAGGGTGTGIIFSFNPVNNVENLLWNFGSGSDGQIPNGDLVYNKNNGLFYGMTSTGGANNYGAICSFNPTNNAENVAWSFMLGGMDGITPWGDLTYDPINGLFYAMTDGLGYGNIIRFDGATNTDTLVWSFGNGYDGVNPYGNLTFYNPANLGVNEVEEESEKVKVFPNPSNGIFQIQANGRQLMATSQIEVYNSVGQKVYSNSQITASSNFQIDLSGQPAGIYFYRILSGEEGIISQGKLIIN